MSQHSASSRRRASARRSNFRSIRVEEDALVRRLRSRHTLWLHGGLMGLITLLVMWGVSTALRHGGVDARLVDVGAVRPGPLEPVVELLLAGHPDVLTHLDV